MEGQRLPGSFLLQLFQLLDRRNERAFVRQCRAVCKHWRACADASLTELSISAAPLCRLQALEGADGA